MTEYRLIGHWVAVLPVKGKDNRAVVKYIGSGCEHCKFNSSIALGDTVIIKENGYTEQEFNGEKLLLICQDDVQAIVNPGSKNQ